MHRVVAIALLTGTLSFLPGLAGAPASAQQPLPPPILRIKPTGSTITVNLVNRTPFVVSYQAIRDTRIRPLMGNSSVILRNLRLPVSLTFESKSVEKDLILRTGLIQVQAALNPKTGHLDVILTPTLNPDADKTAVAIESDGSVYAY